MVTALGPLIHFVINNCVQEMKKKNCHCPATRSEMFSKVGHTCAATSSWFLIWKASETTNTPTVLLHLQICRVELSSV